MDPLIHGLGSLVITLFVYRFISKPGAIAFFVGGFFIDVDHYAFFAITRHNLNLFDAVAYYEYLTYGHARVSFDIFHTVEFMAALTGITILANKKAVKKKPSKSLFPKILFFLLLGMYFHLSLDFAQGFFHQDLGARWWSLTDYLVNH